MSSNKEYLPRTDKDRAIWLKNFSFKLAEHAGNVGILPDEVLSVSKDALMFLYAVESVEIAKMQLAQSVAYKQHLSYGEITSTFPSPITIPMITEPEQVPPNIFKRVRKLVQRIKYHPNFNTSIGKDLGVILTDDDLDRITIKPELKGGLDAHHPFIRWNKGFADSIDIYIDRKDGKGFIFVANDTSTNYIDMHLLPSGVETAIWSYKGIYVVQYEQVGEFSNIVEITVTRQVEV